MSTACAVRSPSCCAGCVSQIGVERHCVISKLNRAGDTVRCTNCQFFPQEPRAMGGIFFHEIAHLLGVPHKVRRERERERERKREREREGERERKRERGRERETRYE